MKQQSIKQILKQSGAKCYCGKEAYTTIVQIPACKDCCDKYCEEGEKYLPMQERVIFKSFLDRARENGHDKAVNYTYHGY